jgi:VWFA-related protein
VADDGSNGPAAANRKGPQTTTPAASLRVEVNMTLVPVSVLDPDGRNITGLTQANFSLLDGKEPRPIAAFSREDQPVAVGLVFDCSRSMRDKFVVAREAPVQLYRQLNEGDETFLVTISDQPVLRQRLTTTFTDIQNALLFTQPDGTTALLDGVYLALSQLKHARNPHKAMIVVSDGGDNNSRYSFRELQKIALEADTQIFAIGLHQGPATPEEESGPELLAGLAHASGGVHFPIQNANEIAGIMAKIGVTLHNQYVLGYYPPVTVQSGKYRPITVQLKVPVGLPPLRIFARAGYYAPER